jgi:hypothetical protein
VAAVTSDTWPPIRDLFEQALDLGGSDPRAWLERQVVGQALKDEVQSLLDNHARAGGFLAGPVTERVPNLFDDEPMLGAGTRLGTYTIVRELGRGGMGRVYLAMDERLGRTVAMKLLAPRLLQDPAERARLRREARAAAGLTHPGICTVYALEETGDDLFIVSEYVDGSTLRAEIGGRTLPTVSQVVDTARQLAEAVAAAHGAGVTHRDLKPENVMRSKDGRLKVLDFGLARLDPARTDLPGVPLTLPGTILGTPAYMAPEQLAGRPVDERADVFALGVLFYEYACSVHPFAAATALAVAARVLEGTAPPVRQRRADLPSHVADAIDRCLRKVASDRFANAAELLAALSSATVGESIVGRDAAGWWRMHQSVVFALYAVAVVAAWGIKERVSSATPVFVAIGIFATVAGMFRGHLLFRERTDAAGFSAELRRSIPVTLAMDLLIAVALGLDGLLIGSTSSLSAVLVSALGVGIALTRLVVEPATIRAAFSAAALPAPATGGSSGAERDRRIP